MEPEDTMDAGDLRACGWAKSPDGKWHHPRLHYGWPRADASRLEHECKHREPAALRLLGSKSGLTNAPKQGEDS